MIRLYYCSCVLSWLSSVADFIFVFPQVKGTSFWSPRKLGINPTLTAALTSEPGEVSLGICLNTDVSEGYQAVLVLHLAREDSHLDLVTFLHLQAWAGVQGESKNWLGREHVPGSKNSTFKGTDLKVRGWASVPSLETSRPSLPGKTPHLGKPLHPEQMGWLVTLVPKNHAEWERSGMQVITKASNLLFSPASCSLFCKPVNSSVWACLSLILVSGVCCLPLCASPHFSGAYPVVVSLKTSQWEVHFLKVFRCKWLYSFLIIFWQFAWVFNPCFHKSVFLKMLEALGHCLLPCHIVVRRCSDFQSSILVTCALLSPHIPGSFKELSVCLVFWSIPLMYLGADLLSFTGLHTCCDLSMWRLRSLRLGTFYSWFFFFTHFLPSALSVLAF